VCVPTKSNGLHKLTAALMGVSEPCSPKYRTNIFAARANVAFIQGNEILITPEILSNKAHLLAMKGLCLTPGSREYPGGKLGWQIKLVHNVTKPKYDDLVQWKNDIVRFSR
jgi:hypothetical protein